MFENIFKTFMEGGGGGDFFSFVLFLSYLQ